MNVQIYSTSSNPLQALIAGAIGFGASLASMWIKAWVDRRTLAKRTGIALISEATTNLRLLGTWKEQLEADLALPADQEAAASPAPLHTAALQAAISNAAFTHLSEGLEFGVNLALEAVGHANVSAEYRQLYRAVGKGRPGYELERKAMTRRVLDVVGPTITSVASLRDITVKTLKLRGRAVAFSNLAVVVRPGSVAEPATEAASGDGAAINN